ncbi:uncharacterized protein LOC132745655 [Ruditapes philippinarum]|uniref:uncharacterized protein LOC132745655 n=1 Tax=Ruditapes philippinarum TaxID=129788 RepID=UPI00295BE25B|nr:uncharacterized protein LOC132745655 [Ruditapes philippinarum]
MLQLETTMLLIFGFFTYHCAASCNGQVRVLTDVSRRGPSYVIKSSSEPSISDSTLASGWYVAKDSARYYTLVNGTSPKYAHCGTANPIYIKDKLGKLDEDKEYSLIACLVDFDNSCKQRYNIKVRKCRQGIQYYLTPTDGTSAYCFEPSSLSVEAAAPNYTIPGNILVSVALMYRLTDQRLEPELDFKCNFASENTSYYYEVSWIINGRLEKTFAPVKIDDVDGTNLNETTFRSLGSKFGISIQCAVRVSSTFTGNQTSPQMSDIFYAGVKILTPQITLSSGSSDSILQPTIPLGCRQWINSSDDILPCFVDIEMFDPNSKYTCHDIALTSLDNQKLCGSRITGWKNASSHDCMHQHNVSYCSYDKILNRLTTYSINISVSNDRLQYPTDKTFTLQLQISKNTKHPFWENVILDHVTIKYSGGTQNLEWRGKICSVQNDPWLNTFDCPWSYIEPFKHYLLYKDKIHFAEVQIKTQKCDADPGHNSSCTCAAAIQAGGDVFVIDICHAVKRASFVHCRGNVLNVREINSNTYQIYLPTGTHIKISREHWRTSAYLNVEVNPSPSDVNNVEGLCGNLNGICDENINTEYLNKWELQQSLFNTLLYYLPPSWTYDHNVCICPRVVEHLDQLIQGNKDSRATCFSQQYATCTEHIELQGEQKTCTIRNKRSVVRHRRNNERLLALSLSNDKLHSRIRKRTVNTHMSEEQAYKECLDVFRSKPTYNMINDLPDIALNQSLSACVNDMMVDGRDFWKEKSYNSWVSVVAQEIARNGTFREEKSDVVRAFNNVTCPSQCNGNGNCTNGTCVCKGDYVGASCFVKKSTPLEFTDIEGGGECDLADGDDCHECLQFHTQNLLKGFKCKIDIDELDVNGTVVHSDKLERNGEYESVFDGYCCPSAAEKRRKKRDVTSDWFTVRYSVSISNDGIHFGRSRNVHVFDSTCQSFVMMQTGDLLFSLKADTCYIGNQCYRDGDRSPISSNLICCPSFARFQWTTQQEYNPENGKESSKVDVVTVSVSVTGILIVACIVVFAIWTNKNRKRAKFTVRKERPKCPDYPHLDFSNRLYN